ncbi:hypothetical protein CIG75_19105 [Tumebacillus algifaecis]|uniref:DUF6440 domain-containing protein n=1 Tax=Tumebacillus algifaecis TaxID=1214604 RepID=A0A223D5H4_9BACL|nr:DUF6440 family protein [Tumebacillus algifaecis]ASS76842.1 hypothetical protein CIG75_19105 [Tumebacillus algifaecis]
MKIAAGTVLVLYALMAVGCGEQAESETSKQRFKQSGGWTRGESAYYILTDTETDCKYLEVENGSGYGITALLDANGEPVCNKSAQRSNGK